MVFGAAICMVQITHMPRLVPGRGLGWEGIRVRVIVTLLRMALCRVVLLRNDRALCTQVAACLDVCGLHGLLRV